MSVLAPGELDSLRAAVAPMLEDRCTINRPDDVTDNAGGHYRDIVTVATGVPCRLAKLGITPREVETTSVVRALSYWSIRFAPGTDIRPIDQVLIGSRTFEVVAGGETTLSLSTTVTAQEIV